MSAPKSRKWLSKGGLAREDSDDELGDEDHPWQWIYDDNTNTEIKGGSSRKRKANALAQDARTPIGARMGRFHVRIGDAVLLKSPEQGKDWAGLVCAFSDIDEDEEEEMCANIQWFCSPAELAGSKKSKGRIDALPNESYITLDFNMNPLTAINGKATVLSKEVFLKKYPKGLPPKSKSAAIKYAKTILCRKGVKQRTLDFTEEFVWEDRYKGPESLLDLIDWIKDQTKTRRKHTKGDSSADAAFQPKAEAEDTIPSTPHKRRKTTSATSTPRSSIKVAKYVTPTHKRIIVKKPLEITPLGTRFLSPSVFTSSPYIHARTTLHVSAVPASLPCRAAEFTQVYQTLHSAITEGTGTCIYISGTPGTGKTATVREVVSALHHAVAAGDLDYDFNFVEINGMKITDPSQSYVLLWEALKGDRVSPSHALSLLDHEFSHPSPRRIPTVVLMDELDQLVTKSQSVMYNFFNWPSQRHSRLIVLAVANTMDLPERTLSNKISSRLGLTRITFPGYTHAQLMEIIASRLENVSGDIVDKDAVQFAARKVAAVSGDARRALDVCRRAVEIAERDEEQTSRRGTNQSQTGTYKANPSEDEENDDADPATPSRQRNKKANINDASEVTPTKHNPNPNPNSKAPSKNLTRITIGTIKRAIQESTTTPLSVHLQTISLSAKLFLAALLALSRRNRAPDGTTTTFGEVLAEAQRIAMAKGEGEDVRRFLLREVECMDCFGAGLLAPAPAPAVGGGGGVGEEMPRVPSLHGAAMELVECGVLAVENGGRVGFGVRNGKVRLRVGEGEVREALNGDEEGKGLGIV